MTRTAEYIKYYPWLFTFGLIICLAAFLSACSQGGGVSRRQAVDAGGSVSSGWALLKVGTHEGGMYEINSHHLEAAGINPEEINSKDLKIVHQGREVPVFVEWIDGSIRLRFFAESSQSNYTNENVYWLIVGENYPEWLMENSEPAPSSGIFERNNAQPAATRLPIKEGYFARLELEQNQIYKPQVSSEDHWFWSSQSAPNSFEIELELDHILPGQGYLALEVWGETEANDNPDHHIIVMINDHILVDESWDGKGPKLIETDLETEVLVEETNVIKLITPGDTGAAADIVLLDKISFSYPRQFSPNEDRIDFCSTGGEHNVIGLSEPVLIFDITEPNQTEKIFEFIESPVEFEGQPGHCYWIAGDEGYFEPLIVEEIHLDIDLRSAGIAAEYIAVGPSDLIQSLEPLLEMRESQGISTRAISLEMIYDQFGGGMPEPEAIRAFLQYAVREWQPAPRYLLLVGDASYDPKGYISEPEISRLPVFTIDTTFGGQTASDTGFAQLTGEEWNPESSKNNPYVLAVGRFPAQNSEQVSAIVDKILAYENEIDTRSLPASWRQGVLAIADGQESSFRSDADEFLKQFPQNYKTRMLAPASGEQDVNHKIVEQFEQGNFLIAYFGHGSVNMWGKDRLFSIADVNETTTGDRYPIVMNLTCLTGLFTHPKTESLAEALLWKMDGGAVAVLAPTSLTLPNDQSYLSESIVQVMTENPELRLGEVLRLARSQMPIDTRGQLEVTHTFLLFGDPALRLPQPEN